MLFGLHGEFLGSFRHAQLWLARIAVPPELGVLARRDHRFGCFEFQCVVNFALVVGTVTKEAFDRLFDLIDHCFERFGVMDVITG